MGKCKDSAMQNDGKELIEFKEEEKTLLACIVLVKGSELNSNRQLSLEEDVNAFAFHCSGCIVSF